MAKKILGFILVLGLGLGTGFLVGRGTSKQKSLKVKQDKVAQSKTVTKIIERPGEKITEIVENRTEVSKSVVVSEERKQTVWNLGVEYVPSSRKYGIAASKRIFGPLFLGGTFRANENLSNQEFGLILSVEF